MKQIKQEIVDFIEEKVGVVVDDQCLMFEDLGIDGLDSEIFMEEFAKQFSVDMIEFDGKEYFLSEYELGNIFLKLYWVLFDKNKLKKKCFNLNHLVEVVKKKKWFDQPN